VLGQFNIIVSLTNQVADQVFHITAHIPGFTELCGISLDERHADFLRYQPDHVGFANTGGSHHKDVVLYGPDNFIGSTPAVLVFDAVKVGADFGGQNFLGIVLLDNELIKVGNQFLGL